MPYELLPTDHNSRRHTGHCNRARLPGIRNITRLRRTDLRRGRHHDLRLGARGGRRDPAPGLVAAGRGRSIVGGLAGLLPAIRAARLSPTQALWSI